MNASLRKCKKVTFLFFSGKLENWSFWAASVQNWSQNDQKCPKSMVFHIFSKTSYWISLIFCMNASLRECKKVTFLLFSGKLENWSFWAASVQNWPFLAKTVKNAQNRRLPHFFENRILDFPNFLQKC